MKGTNIKDNVTRDNEWVHLTGLVDDQVAKFYVNGVLVGEKYLSNNIKLTDVKATSGIEYICILPAIGAFFGRHGTGLLYTPHLCMSSIGGVYQKIYAPCSGIQ